MDPHPRDEAKEAELWEIIAHGSDVVLSFLNVTCTDGLERHDEEAGYDDDQTMEEEGHRMTAPVTEWRGKDTVTTAPMTKRRGKDTVMMAPVTERSPDRYIYIN